MTVTLYLAQQPDADALLSRSPFALLTGMLLDQQIPIEWAFCGPRTIAQRLGVEDLDPLQIAASDPDAFAAVLAARPAVHRYPSSMAKRIQQLATHIAENYGGDAEAIWRDAASGADLLGRVAALPGFGTQKAQIFVALLGKQFGVRPQGWRESAGAFGVDGTYRSVADIVDADSLAQVRLFKQEMKAAAKASRVRGG